MDSAAATPQQNALWLLCLRSRKKAKRVNDFKAAEKPFVRRSNITILSAAHQVAELYRLIRKWVFCLCFVLVSQTNPENNTKTHRDGWSELKDSLKEREVDKRSEPVSKPSMIIVAQMRCKQRDSESCFGFDDDAPLVFILTASYPGLKESSINQLRVLQRPFGRHLLRESGWSWFLCRCWAGASPRTLMELVKKNVLKRAAKEWTRLLPQNVSVWIMKSIRVFLSHTRSCSSMFERTSIDLLPPWILSLVTKCPKVTPKRPRESNINPLNMWGSAKMFPLCCFLDTKCFIKGCFHLWVVFVYVPVTF